MPEKPTDMTAEAGSLVSLFADTSTRFRIQEFQRDYVWTTKRTGGREPQVPRFWRDVERLIGSHSGHPSRDPLFLGTLVFKELEAGGAMHPPLSSVIDGQQRLMTLFLTLVAFTEALRDLGQDDLATNFAEQYLLVRKPDLFGLPRLEPGYNDRAQFNSILIQLQDSRVKYLENTGPETGALTDAWAVTREKVRSLISDDDGSLSLSKLQDILTTILERVHMVVINLGITHDPNEVFERLNTDGHPLTDIDLTRNFVVRTADPTAAGIELPATIRSPWSAFERRVGEYHKRYFPALAAIRNPDSANSQAFSFLRDYWLDSTTNGERGPDQAKAVVRDIEEYLDEFLAVVAGIEPTGYESQDWRAIERLYRLQPSNSMLPYLLPLLSDLRFRRGEVEQLRACLEVIEAYVVRRAFAGAHLTGLTGIFRQLGVDRVSDPQELAKRIESPTIPFPDDERFQRDVTTYALYRSKLKTFVLYEYEVDCSAGGDPPVWSKDLTVDHVMPQALREGEWTEIDVRAQQRLGHTWGNLVLLSPPGNSIKNSKSWLDAKPVLEKSKFESTRQVSRLDEWTASAIEERGRQLADWALQRWPKPEV